MSDERITTQSIIEDVEGLAGTLEEGSLFRLAADLHQAAARLRELEAHAQTQAEQLERIDTALGISSGPGLGWVPTLDRIQQLRDAELISWAAQFRSNYPNPIVWRQKGRSWLAGSSIGIDDIDLGPDDQPITLTPEARAILTAAKAKTKEPPCRP